MNDTEMRLKFQRIEDTLQGQDTTLIRIEKTLEEVKEKATYTNGKVAEIVKWQERARGGLWVLGAVMVLIVMPLSGWVLYNQAQETRHINAAIGAYLQNNYKAYTPDNAK